MVAEGLEIVAKQLSEDFLSDEQALADLDFIVTLGLELFGKLTNTNTPLEYCDEVILPHLNDSNSYYALALKDGKPVGYFIYQRITEDADKQYFTECLEKAITTIRFKEESFCLTDFGVIKQERCNGIGGALLKFVLQQIKTLGGKQVYATCWRGEQGQSLSLVRKYDFVEIGKYIYTNGDQGIVVMKEL